MIELVSNAEPPLWRFFMTVNVVISNKEIQNNHLNNKFTLEVGDYFAPFADFLGFKEDIFLAASSLNSSSSPPSQTFVMRPGVCFS